METFSTRQGESPPTSPEFEALAALADAYLATARREDALLFMRRLASALAVAPENVISIEGGRDGAASRRIASAWLSRRLAIWLAEHG
jgi:hypothetical protein